VKSRSKSVSDELHDLGHNVPLKVDAQFFIIRIQVLLKVRVRQLITRLVLAVILRILLDGIVCKMDHPAV
jgi:hypothetical protein